MVEPSDNRSTQYRMRAEEIRTIADGMYDRECRAALLKLAKGYDDMAERAERLGLSGPEIG
jgi:hypothetical protein